jgi:hypothetical protein
MTSPYQRASFNRKVLYWGIVIALFVCTLFLRGVVAFEGKPRWTVRGQAEDLELTELSQQTEADLSGSTVRLLLTGSRGLVVCALWYDANDKQLHNEWSELERTVKSITKLQPHHAQPWLFQAWNLSYNVSVELDRLNDMYFYIHRGINLLAEGETLNKNNPDLRHELAFYYQNKFGVSDKVNTLRCLFNLSCIPPEERDYRKLENPDHTVNLDAFKEFCRKNPQLVRRLRESSVACGTPRDVVEFLKANEKVPGRYQGHTRELADRLKQFPVLPPWPPNYTKELTSTMAMGDQQADGYRAARSWYSYALEAVPPPSGEPEAIPTDFDHRRYRIPRKPALIIFRSKGPQSQSNVAERLQKEGWFDSDPWMIDEGLSLDADRWFPTEVAIAPSDSSKEAWQEAYTTWEEYGRQNGLSLSEEQKASYYRRAERYASSRGIGVEDMTQPLRPEERADPAMYESYLAHQRMTWLRQNLHLTQFERFLHGAEAEKDEQIVEARKLLAKAERYKSTARIAEAIETFEKAFPLWRRIFDQREQFHELETVQEQVYEKALEYDALLKQERDGDNRRRAALAARDLLSFAGAGVGGVPLRFATSRTALRSMVPALQTVDPVEVQGPFDGNDSRGRPWIADDVKRRVKERLGLLRPRPPAAPAIPPPGATPRAPSSPPPAGGPS